MEGKSHKQNTIPVTLVAGFLGSGKTTLINSVLKRFSVGVEYMAGKQRIVNGTEGFAQRIQFAAKLNFTD